MHAPEPPPNRFASPRTPAPALPPALSDLARFLKVASRLGTEIAFWRSQARLAEMRHASAELHSILLSPRIFTIGEPNRSLVAKALEDLLSSLAALKQAVPFRTRVGAMRRSLMPCYQEVFILHQLVLAVIARMRLNSTDRAPASPRAGSLMDLNAKQELRDAVKLALPFWRKEDWDVYDCL